MNFRFLIVIIWLLFQAIDCTSLDSFGSSDTDQPNESDDYLNLDRVLMVDYNDDGNDDDDLKQRRFVEKRYRLYGLKRYDMNYNNALLTSKSPRRINWNSAYLQRLIPNFKRSKT